MRRRLYRVRQHEDHVLAALEGSGVEPAVERIDLEARLLDQTEPLGCGQPVQAEARAVVAGAHRERERAGGLVPDCALEDAGLALEPAVVRLVDVLAARRKHVEHEPALRLEELTRGTKRPQLLGLGLEVQQRAEGADRERDPLTDGRLSQVADAQVEALGDAGRLRGGAGDRQHLRRGIDSDHVDAGLRDRNRDPAGADGQLDHGAARGESLVDVEADVLRDGPAPRVVEARDRAVQAHLSPACA